MAQIVIQDILGSDNVGASRSVIAANFKILSDGLNKIETYLNTTPSGGSINIGLLTIAKYTRPITDVILSCEASANIAGNITIGTIGQGTTFTINSAPTFNYAADFKKDVTFSKLTAGNTVSVKTKLSIEDLLIIPVNITSTIAVTSGLAIDVAEVPSAINLEWDEDIEREVTLEDGVDGQILIIRNSGTYTTGILTFSNTDGSTIISLSLATPANLSKVKLILQYVEAAIGNHWEVISIVGVETWSDYTIG